MRKSGTAVAALVAAAALTTALAAGAQASTTIGQVIRQGVLPGACTTQLDDLQIALSSGPSYEVSDDGVITSWSTNNTVPVPGQEMTFKLFKAEPESGHYKVLAHDGPRPLVAGLNTFKVHIPVNGGEVIGLNTANASGAIPVVCDFNGGDPIVDRDALFVGNGADGSSIGPPTDFDEATRVNVSATFVPAPDISTFGKVSLGSIAGGGKVTLEGNHFEEVEKVTFGGVPAKSFTVKDEHHVEAVAPAGKSLAGVAAAVTTVAGTATSTPSFFYSGCQVPKVTGKTLAAAKKKIKAAGCKLGRVAKVRGRHGKVVKQSPKAGKVLAPGAKVSLKVGR